MGHDNSQAICVDLDGTLTPIDTTFAACLALLRLSPMSIPKLLPNLSKQRRPQLKAVLAGSLELSPSQLPWRRDVFELVCRYRGHESGLFLVTGTHREFARQVAEYLGVFDDFLGTVDFNLTGSGKCQTLVKNHGEGGFTYFGNSQVDAAVWASSGAAVVVGGAKLRDTAANLCPVIAVFEKSKTLPILSFYWKCLTKGFGFKRRTKT